ncbi:MAG: response regulator [Magnetococcales bacterium]|nr:response regulator [Magnetococcales bacterium]
MEYETQIPENICCVDDDQYMRLLLTKTLESLGGFSVTAFESGKEMIKSDVPDYADLFLLDVDMPEMDGFEVIKQLRSNPDRMGVPILLLTADVTICNQPKEYRVLHKPFDPRLLPSMIVKEYNTLIGNCENKQNYQTHIQH